MKTSIKDYSSLSITDNEYFKNKKEKFELVSCPIHEIYCKKIRPALNKNYLDSEMYHINKEYQKSIELLKNAHSKTFDLKEHSCANCAQLFRSTIEQSLLKLHKEQRRASRGLFRFKGYQPASLNLDPVLKEI